MSTSTVLSAWATVMAHATIQAYTTKIYANRSIPQSEKEVSDLRYGQKVNAVFYEVTQGQEYAATRTLKRIYTVRVTYIIEKDTAGANWKTCRSFFDDLFTTVHNQIGTSWSSSVDFFTPPADVTVSEDTLSNKAIWRGEATYTAQSLEAI